jgi:alpha-L-fucosidase
MNRQLTEILTNYGPVGAIWFDGWWDHDMDPKPFDWHLPEQYALIHRLQPSCMIGNNHHGDPFPGEDFQIYEQDLPGENTHGLSGQAASDLPLEACITMNDSWGYNITDKNYKSSDDLIRELVKAAGKDCNLLLNIGPRPDGCLPDEALERLRAIGEFMKIYAPTINGTRGGFVAPHSWGVTTQKGNTLYVHILDLDDDALFLPTGGRKVAGAKVYATGEKVGVKASGEGVVLSFPQAPHGVDYVVELTLKD